MTTSEKQCPACHSTDVLFSSKRNEWICEDCTHRWQEHEAKISAPVSSSIGPLKIFLSYGRSDSKGLADQLAKDLGDLGHDVWLDTREIRPGSSWGNEIVDGLRSAQVVIALMSPHSVRTARAENSPDGVDSVCLSEITYALFNPPPQPIIPVMAMKCEPPLAIFHLDYVEMTRWNDSPSQYRDGLDRILLFVSEVVQKKGPRYKSWYHQLQPWDFAAFLHDKRKNFTGREWLFAEIDTWRATSGVQRVLLITGDPGVGKSAIVAQLVHDNINGQVVAYHCCQSNTLATLESWRFVRSAAAMLASRLPEYAAQLDIPAVRDILTEESCRQDPGSAFERGVIAPLETIHAPTEGVRYILIDALDEALTLSTGTTIVDLLSTVMNRLPVWLRVVATTRKEPAVLRQLQGLPARELKADDPENEEDLRRYIRHRLSTDHLQFEVNRIATASHPPISPETVMRNTVEALVKFSGGNFLYVRHALDEIESPPKLHGPQTFSLDRLDELPTGLEGMYEKFFQRQFGLNAERYSEVKSILEVICAAREPLEEQILAAAAGLNFRSEFPVRWRLLAQYLPARKNELGETTYAPFHKSLTDWLTSDKTRLNSKFGILREEGDRKLANLCWDKFEKRKKAPPPNQYWVRHGVAHLLRTCDHLHKELLPNGAPLEKYENVVRAIDIMGWLNSFSSPIEKNIVAGALPLLSIILIQTESDLDSPGLAENALRALEAANQQILFDLVKDTCATDITELVVGWIGRTQKAGWRELVPQMLKLNEYVVRYAAGCGQAARYQRLVTDGEQHFAAQEINEFLTSSDINEQEMASYAVGEIAKSQLSMPEDAVSDNEVAIPTQISQWLKLISDQEFYFCQSVLGDILLNLTLQGQHEQVVALDQLGVIGSFWNPIWQYTRLDVVSMLALRAFDDQPVFRDITPFQAEVELELSAIRTRESRIESFVKKAGSRGPELAKILHKTEVDDVDNDTIKSWLTREGLDSKDPDHRVRTAVEFLELMFTHPFWQMCEKGSAILPLLGGEAEWRDTCIQILDMLLNSLDPSENGPDPSSWRVILGTSEACYLSRHFDPGREIVGGRIISRMESCWLKYYHHWNCHVRALLAEGFFFIVGEKDLGKSGWKTGRAAMYLMNLTEAIDFWMLDRDVWVLEHVYQAFRIITIEQEHDESLREWAEKRFAHVDANPLCLLALVSQAVGKSWVNLERDEFLKQLQAVRRPQPFPA